MRLIIITIPIILTSMFSSCLRQSLGSLVDDINIQVIDNIENANIIVKYGQSYKFEFDTLKLFKVKLERLRGGRTSLFGIFEISKWTHDPDEFKRIILSDSTRFIKEYSINDILKLDTIMVDSMVVYKLK
ncbi:MAG: hypothetical protein IPO85_11965 [Saprospiraceae bacterium]|uniref:Lipoprotein n=1 Tax=Candidatus Defluviibacterium haderslevense TaxID=2981993 RepID=A0A9D7SAP0_9BACT|nr:hypothetical protein [Candidatus Defluviibacterium haderslevense]